ncbi:STAS domain-containing protein [uncultured Thioclava sp.]|uniref:STAS domain-containing protein n=1 Tax=uncultured Thioclava sp. TaxID=473858 RepID=UPI0025FA0470|nr:STAS domain-containing protein [uncultured Thioclava sp.]
MNLFSEACDGALVVRVDEPRLDAAVAIRFKEQMREVTAQPAHRVILDMSKIEFLDSSGLGAVVAVMKALAPHRQLELCGLTGNVDKVFRLTRMDTVFRIHTDLTSALSEGRKYA